MPAEMSEKQFQTSPKAVKFKNNIRKGNFYMYFSEQFYII